MNDKLFIAAFIYLFLLFTTAGALPSSLWTGQYTTLEDTDNYTTALTADINDTAPPDGFFERTTFIYRLATLLFTPFFIEGVPELIGSFLALINYLCLFVGGIFLYDKLRGIGG